MEDSGVYEKSVFISISWFIPKSITIVHNRDGKVVGRAIAMAKSMHGVTGPRPRHERAAEEIQRHGHLLQGRAVSNKCHGTKC